MHARMAGLFDPGWTVSRHGRTVRVDLAHSVRFSPTDADSIVAATEELLNDEVVIVEVVGPADASIPPRGLARVVRSLLRLAERRGQQLIVGSI